MEIREIQIEDILTSSPILMKKIFGFNDDLHLIGKQIILPSGRLDMLYAYQKELLLIELKVVAFQHKFIKQVLDYKKDLLNFQQMGKLVAGYIRSYLMLPSVNEKNRQEAESNNIFIQEYNPEDVLSFFYDEKLKPITSFSELKPIDIGIWNIHLINKFIYFLEKTSSIQELLKLTGGASKSLYNKIKFASELNLVKWKKNKDYIILTDIGKKYVKAKDEYFENTLSEGQAKLLQESVIENPYASSVVIGIASIVECVFSLAKTIYPVPQKNLEEYFCIYSGKLYDWQTDSAKMHGAKMYANYAIDLGLMASNDKNIFLTPEGLKFIIQMQMHKSLRMLNHLSIN